MRKLQKHVFTLVGENLKLGLQLAKPLKKAFKKRQKMVETNLHYVRVLLNPYLLHNKKIANDQKATNTYKRVLQ